MRIRASNLRSLMGKLHARLSKLHTTCRKEQFEKKLVMGENVYCFYHFWNLIKIWSEFLRRSFGTVFKTAFHVYRWSFRERRTNLLNNTKIFIFFENSSVKFTEFDGEASSTVVKTAFYMYEGTSREKIDVGEKSLLFYHFWILIKIC